MCIRDRAGAGAGAGAAVPAAVPAAPIEPATPAAPVAAPVELLAVAAAEQPVLAARPASSVRQAGAPVTQFQVALIGTAMFLAGALALGRRPVRRPALAYR